MARRAWEEFAYKGWGLRNICSELGYKFHHHNALEDAKAAGFIMLSAIEKTGLDAEAWLTRVKHPLNIESSSQTIKRQGNPNGSLYGDVLVFTGALSLLRNEAASMAANLGCQVDETVTKRTTLLVIGDQDEVGWI